jgi:hypothetical protein
MVIQEIQAPQEEPQEDEDRITKIFEITRSRQCAAAGAGL